MNHSLKYLLLTVIVAVATAAGANEPVKLPDLGGTSTRVLSPDEEARFPQEFSQFMRANDLLVEDPLISDYFSDMGFRLVSRSDRSKDAFHFFVLKERSEERRVGKAWRVGGERWVE